MENNVVRISEGEMDKAEIERLQSEVRTIHETMSWSAIHKESGIPVGTLSQFASGSYAGNNQNIAEKVKRWLDGRADAERVRASVLNAPEWVETPTSNLIWQHLSFAHHLKDMTMISGGPGLGKTITINRYAGRYPQVEVVTMSSATKSAQNAIMTVAKTLGCSETRRDIVSLTNQVTDKLRNTDSMLIVDEAQFLSDDGIEILRSIHDDTGTPLVLAGNEQLYKRFAQVGVDSLHAQVRSRIGLWLRQLHPTEADVKAILKAWEIDDPRVFELLKLMAMKPGALRAVTKCLRLASLLSEDSNITPAALRAAYSRLSLDAA
tara:strand:+ start:5488 stop:6450 length:963 start_codon:yes stop_codon:yes gene_type:complete